MCELRKQVPKTSPYSIVILPVRQGKGTHDHYIHLGRQGNGIYLSEVSESISVQEKESDLRISSKGGLAKETGFQLRKSWRCIRKDGRWCREAREKRRCAVAMATGLPAGGSWGCLWSCRWLAPAFGVCVAWAPPTGKTQLEHCSQGHLDEGVSCFQLFPREGEKESVELKDQEVDSLAAAKLHVELIVRPRVACTGGSANSPGDGRPVSISAFKQHRDRLASVSPL